MKQIKIRTRIMLMMSFLIILTSIIFSSIIYILQRDSLLKGIDDKLISVATAAKSILPDNYHDKITGINSVSKKDYDKIVDIYNKLCLRLNLEYIWSLMLIDNKIVFTTATSPGKDVAKGDNASFFDVHTNPELYEKAFSTMKLQRRINKDKWGNIRVVLIPSFDSKGRKFLFGSSVKVTEVKSMIRSLISNAAFITLAVLCIGLLLSFFVSESISSRIRKLTVLAENISNGDLNQKAEIDGSYEIVSLSKSINTMSMAISEKIQEIKKSEGNLKKLNSELNTKNMELHTALEELEATNEEFEAQNVELIESQTELLNKEKQFRTMLDQMPLPVLLEMNGEVIYLNRMFIDAFGYSSKDFTKGSQWIKKVIGNDTCINEYNNEFNYKIKNSPEGGVIDIDTKKMVSRDGRVLDVDIKITQFDNMTLSILNDVTNYKKSQEFLIQTEKMMTIGGLAAGMAHEINNPLAVILQGVQLTQNRLSPDIQANREIAVKHGAEIESIVSYLKERKILEFLNSIKSAGNRAAKIVKNMLSFSRRSETSLYPENINIIIDNTLEIISKDYDLYKRYDFRNIKIVKKYDKTIPKINCSLTELEQVLLNILKNAAQAMSEINENDYIPMIVITTYMDYDFVGINIQDNGPGMDNETLKHLFDPFYTTKEVGVGTGLGLSVSYFIITSHHNGFIDVDSTPGKGAKFTIKLPVTVQ